MTRWLALALAAVLAVGVTLLAGRAAPRARLDLTEGRLYTLTPGTRQVLAGLKEPVTLRLSYSRRITAEAPQVGAHAARVRALLREYAAASPLIRLQVEDPEPFSDAEDRVTAAGLTPVPLNEGGEQVFFGLAGRNARDEERAIPFFDPSRERFLEADLTRLVFELSDPPRPVLGVMTPLPLNGDPRALLLRQPALARPQVVMQQLRESFEVREVPLATAAIPPEVTLLLVAHPQGLPDATQYALDQFVLRGGRLILLLDPHSEMQATRPGPDGRPPRDTASALPRLLDAWGVEAPEGQVVLDLRGAWRVRARPGDRVQAVDYLPWFSLQGDSLNRQEVATAALEPVAVASAGVLRRREGLAGEWVPLLTTSAQSMLVPAERVGLEADPVRLLAGFRAGEQRHVVAARLRAPLATAFPDGPPSPAEGLPPHLARSQGPATLVLIHDTDLLDDRFWVQQREGAATATPFGGNGAFILNLADALAGSDAMISLRSRGEALRPFALVESIRRRADAQFRASEQALTERLQATEARLRELRQGSGARNADQVVLTPEQRAEVERARAQIAATRQELRAVQLELRRDIEALERTLRWVNIALVPALLALAALGVALWRRRQRAA
ncbi:Gldg family protein [Roseococcus sp. DSY-14]|uniref:Gldg family protein n=1 Tax=Roseococcus sp. DSY-14 TaxID=3369650 RepID=UPI00387B237C